MRVFGGYCGEWLVVRNAERDGEKTHTRFLSFASSVAVSVAQEETHFPSVEREMVRKGKIVTVTSSRARERERRGTRRERAHLDEGEQLFPVAGIPLFARARPSVLAQERNGRKRLPRGCVDHRGLLRKE